MRRLSLWVWAAWVTLVALSFAGLETYALLTTADGDTLSEATRRWLGIEPAAPWRIAGTVGFSAVLLGFTAWFLPHIAFKWGWWQPFQRKDGEAGLIRWSYAPDGRTLLHERCGGEVTIQTMTCTKCGAKNQEGG